MSYTDDGMLATLKDGENNLTTFEYDGFDRLSKTRYPSPTKGSGTSSTTDYELLTYDANSNVYTRRVRSGAIIDYRYDLLNRLTLKDSAALAAIDYTYDNLGRMLTAKFDGSGQGVTNTYDALSRLTSTSSDVGGTARMLTNAYDAVGRRTRLTWPDGFYVDYDYLVTGEVSAVRENGATTGPGVLATLDYGNLWERLGLTRGNGTSTIYRYDPVSRLTRLTVDLSGTANDVTKTFTYNPANQSVTQTTSNDAYAFTGLANGSTTSTTNGLNELATVGGVTATNDTNANLTYAGTGTFSYDVENKLLHVTTGGVAANSIYDPLARLTQLTGTAVSDRTFVTDPVAGDAVVAEHSSGGALQGRYVFVGMNEPIVSYDNAGNRTWLAADERGSIIAAVNASGAASAIYSYDEYGVPAASNAGRFGYTGQVRLPEVVEAGLYYYKNRMYLSPQGRFPQPDPIGYAGGANLYPYVGNDPINFVDPLGLLSACVTGPGTIGGIVVPGSSVTSCSEVGGEPAGDLGGVLGVALNAIEPRPPRVSRQPGEGKKSQQQQPQCPTGNLGKLRQRALDAAKWTGIGSGVTAVAGAIPTPATPLLEGTALALQVGSVLSTATALGTDFVFFVQTGNYHVFINDAAGAGFGAVPLGGIGSKANQLSSIGRSINQSTSGKIGERLGNLAQNANASFTWPDNCG